MSGLTLTLRAVHHGERTLERSLLAAAQRHRTEHEIHHVATDLARWSHEHAERAAQTARHYGLDLPGGADRSPGDLLAAVRERASELLGHRPEPGLLLLRDLRDLHLAAVENSLHWQMLSQLAKATRDSRLLDLASACLPRTERQIAWTTTAIRTHAPQTLSALT